ncbi:hypothetical protein PTSG_08106 [Salpingoeca rosetta]|uniref:dihydrolipoyllysine-residue succinyltransferase n=1 Tax=Salpingoeca rosetta (strain ATCC 50818 / BSB-021) TaxID=946362 RepID=F2UI05_SALR5|nr:uncharacterized protein PTSG_08106 [Salpingoeca rosetta]EGD76754.1 hypothetical protein PTSG_08106 [Salpingoeca rosetta]|eukprot:XP_004991126.1 hypothetical protein PTSG_08106 [Salpingoeca rosetta]
MWRDAVLVLVAVKVLLLPQVDTLALVCGMLAFYMLVHMYMSKATLLSLPTFAAATVVAIATATYMHSTDQLTACWGYGLFAAVVVAFRFDTHRHWRKFHNTRRKLMVSTWRSTAEGSIYGFTEVDATRLMPFLKEQSDKSGTKITITHAVIKAIGLVLKKTPEVNGRLVFGRYYPADTADVSCLVAMQGKEGFDLGLTKVPDADLKPLPDVAKCLRRNAGSLRGGKDHYHEARKPLLSWVPAFLLEPLVVITGWLAALGITIRSIGVQGHPFGTAIITSVGMLGLDMCFVPHPPFARVPLLAMVGKLQDKPCIDKATGGVVSRPFIPVTFTVDHRFLDGQQGAVMAEHFKQILEDPQTHMA